MGECLVAFFLNLVLLLASSSCTRRLGTSCPKSLSFHSWTLISRRESCILPNLNSTTRFGHLSMERRGEALWWTVLNYALLLILCSCFLLSASFHLQTINSLLGELPLELTRGSVQHAWVTLPLKNITASLVDNCKLELESLRLNFAPYKVKRASHLPFHLIAKLLSAALGQRPLGDSRAWGSSSDYGTRSINAEGSITESADHESILANADMSGLMGEQELNQIIDQMLLVLENVRLKDLRIELEYDCPSLGGEAVLCVDIPSFEYSDVTRLAKPASGIVSPQVSWSFLLKPGVFLISSFRRTLPMCHSHPSNNGVLPHSSSV